MTSLIFAAPVLACMTCLSLLSDWIRRRDVDYVEGSPIERKHWFQWGTCWPWHPAYPDGLRDRPQLTHRYALILLPSWSMEIGYNGRLEWHQRVLYKLSRGPWEIHRWPDNGWIS